MISKYKQKNKGKKYIKNLVVCMQVSVWWFSNIEKKIYKQTPKLTSSSLLSSTTSYTYLQTYLIVVFSVIYSVIYVCTNVCLFGWNVLLLFDSYTITRDII